MSKIFIVLDEMERYLLEMFEIETYVRDRDREMFEMYRKRCSRKARDRCSKQKIFCYF